MAERVKGRVVVASVLSMIWHCCISATGSCAASYPGCRMRTCARIAGGRSSGRVAASPCRGIRVWTRTGGPIRRRSTSETAPARSGHLLPPGPDRRFRMHRTPSSTRPNSQCLTERSSAYNHVKCRSPALSCGRTGCQATCFSFQ